MSTPQVSSGDQGPHEREMSKHQRGLVDVCFEEGQYEAGITTLEQLRSAVVKPYPSHIRQLLYIALLPPPATKDDGVNGFPTPSKFASPSKLARQKRSNNLPSAEATEAALRLLDAYTITNSPGSLLRALPSHGAPESSGVAVPDPSLQEPDEDSFVAREAASIAQCRCCWEILKEAFVIRKKDDSKPDKGKGKRRTTEWDNDEHEMSPVMAGHACVGPHAWPILEWLIRLFETDEEKDSLVPYSSLLLAQIPAARSGKGQRWDTSAILDVFFLCLRQNNADKMLLGGRLLSLLIALTNSPDFDASAFADNLLHRLSSQEPHILPATLSAIRSSPAAMTFKLLLCKSYLSTSAGPGGSRSRPQARAQPRAAPRARANLQAAPSATDVTRPAPAAAMSKRAVMTAADVLRALATDPTSAQGAATQAALMKFELVVAFDALQRQATEGDRDAEWSHIVKDGRLRQAVDASFNGEDGRDVQNMKKLLNTIVAV